MEKQKIKQEFRQIGAGSVRFIATRNEVLDFIFNLIDQTKKETREETIIEAVRKIEKLRKQVAKQAGLRYDEQYENCIDVLNKLKK